MQKIYYLKKTKTIKYIIYTKFLVLKNSKIKRTLLIIIIMNNKMNNNNKLLHLILFKNKINNK